MSVPIEPAAGRQVLSSSPPAARRRAGVLAGLATAAGVALLGAPVGLLWSALAPRADIVVRDGAAGLRDLTTKDFIAADGILFLLGLAAGVAVGLLAWRYGRPRGTGALVGLVVGAALASALAWQVGVRTDDREATRSAVQAADVAAGPGQRLEVPLELRSRAALLGWPAAATLTWTLLALRRPDLLSQADGPVSWVRPARD